MRGRNTRYSRATEYIDKHVGAVLAAPAIIVILVMIAYPVGFTLYMSLHSWFASSIYPPQFIGLGNFAKMLSDPRVWNSLKNSVYFVSLAVSMQLALGMIIALILNKDFRGKGLVRTLFLMPMMATPVAVALVLMMLVDPSMGILNYILGSLALPQPLWLASPNLVIPTLALFDTWQWTPFVVLILLAGLASLPHEPYEAAIIDGASKSSTFRYITLPLMWPTISVALMFRTIDAWKTFDIIYVTTLGGPAWASELLNMYAWNNSLKYMHIGYGSANLVLLALIVFLLVFVFMRWRRSLEWGN